MENIFKDYLFQKHILVRKGDSGEEHILESLFSLANLFQIRVKEGQELVQHEMIAYVSGQLGEEVPKPFYKGFPQTVRKLSPDVLVFDQLLHYTRTYGLGDFSEAGHSLFEEQFDRIAFKESGEIREFIIITEKAAEQKLKELVQELLRGTRPLNDSQFELVFAFSRKYGLKVEQCASKNTAVRLLLALREKQYAKFLALSDVIKVTEELNYRDYGNPCIRKLNLKNQDRKFLAGLIDELVERMSCDIRSCYEKKTDWCGLLHHIHYRAKSAKAKTFVDAMRGKGNHSVYSVFEKSMKAGDTVKAAKLLKEGKGGAAVIRNLQYLISRCKNEDEIQAVLKEADSGNCIVLLQLLLKYDAEYKKPGNRVFQFTKFNQLKIHREDDEEAGRRKSVLTKTQTEAIASFAGKKLREILKGKLGKVYVDLGMKRIALPLRENTSQGGLGVLSRGSRIPIGEGKKIRAFTYWEKVDDIDLSVFGIEEDGTQTEFSWRTMAGKQSRAIAYSGDETSGFHGGSEYFDIELESFCSLYPKIRYLIFCDNVFSGTDFNRAYCKAGYMMRDHEDSGEIYEPKTVKSSFKVNCKSTFAYLFGIDLKEREFVWLNMTKSSAQVVAGDTDMSFLTDVFHVTDVINLYSFFEMMAGELVTDPKEAEVLVSDTMELPGGSGNQKPAEVIRSFDFEKIMALMSAHTNR